MRVLIVEDDFSVARSIKMILASERLTCVSVDLGEDGIEHAVSGAFDIVLLDLSLPDMNGFEVIARLRGAGVTTPVIVLSGDVTSESRIRALRAGADDYLSKPFNGDELVARLKAIVRRSALHAPSLVTTGKLTVNLDDKSAMANGARIPLTMKEYTTLEALSLRKGSAISKEALLQQLYCGRDEPKQKIIDVFVCKLRKKIADATGGPHYIRTVWGLGYELNDPGQAAA